ncbi:MAG: TlpA disulfide reductase family protein [Cyclobacteriaceae bacterium]
MMRKLIFTTLLLTLVVFANAQTYDFVAKDLEQKSLMELGGKINLDLSTKIYTATGDSIAIQQLNDFFQDPKTDPVFFVNKEGEIKAIVFEKAAKMRKMAAKEQKSKVDGLAVGNMMPDIAVTDMDGNKVQLDDYRGKVVALNFWFIACKPCIMEMPELNKFVSKYKDEEVVFLAVTFDKSEDVKKFLKKKKFTYTIAPGEFSAISGLGIQTFPTNIIVDKEGKIAFYHKGYNSALMPEIDLIINKLVND